MAKILVLGAGMVGSAMARDLAPRHQVVATDRYSAALARLSDIGGIDTKQLDASDDAALRAAAAEIDLVICALPGFLGFRTLKTLIEAGSNVADISFMPEDALKLDDLARDRGVVVVTDVGVAPGLDHLILGHHDAHMQVRRFECLVGGLPKERTFPWQYKVPFSPMDVIEEYVRPARKVEAGRVVVMPALSEPELVDFDGVGRLEAFNTDGLRSLIRTMGHVPDMREKTLRYPGHRDLVLALRESGFLSGEPVTVDGSEIVPRAVTSAILFDQWQLRPGEEEFTVMRVTVEGLADGRQVRHVWHLHHAYDPVTGISSMARTTGTTCTGVAEAILDGTWTKQGVSPGEIVGRDQAAFDRIIGHLGDRGIRLRHETVAVE